ncbi:MAG: cell division protein ZapA [Candidatus Symbiothrix sp.]|jgi:cell division protein ZapA|nr:cell division protein ZapA [Candidatus Symbiothrix sp.]
MAAEDDYLKIQLGIYGKYFPYTCKRTDEGVARRAARLLDTKLMGYSSHYSDAKLDELTLLRLAGFHFSWEALEEKMRNETGPIMAKIHRLNVELEDFLARNRQITE